MAVVVGRRNVKDNEFNNKCYAVDATLELALHTIKLCQNEKIFLPEYKETITDRLLDTSMSIYLNAYRANNINASKDVRKWNERDSRQRAAISMCGDLLALINLAKRAFHLRSNKANFWIGKVVSAKKLLIKWNEADYGRYHDK